MKGQIIEGAVIGIIFAVACFMIIIIPYIFTRIQFVETISAESVQNNGQLVLLSLLSSTYQNKPIYQILVDHVTLGQYPDIQQIISPRLAKFSNCYSLQIGNETLTQSSNCTPHVYTAMARIVLPYQHDKKTALLNLTID